MLQVFYALEKYNAHPGFTLLLGTLAFDEQRYATAPQECVMMLETT